MNQNQKTLRDLKNAEGKRLLEKNRLEYSKEIINILKKDQKILSELLDRLELTEKDLYEYISGDKKGNITLYDETLNQVTHLTKERKNNKENR